MRFKKVRKHIAFAKDTNQVKNWEERFLQYVETSYPTIMTKIKKDKIIDDESEKILEQSATAFNEINTQLMEEEM